MSGKKISKSGIITIALLVVLLFVVAYFAWYHDWGRLSFYVQRLDHEDPEVARTSEMALLELGQEGREELCKFLTNKLDIKLPHMSFESETDSRAFKVVAVAKSGEVGVAGTSGPVRAVLLLADGMTPVDKLFQALGMLAETGTTRVLASARPPDSRIGTLGIELVYHSPHQMRSFITLRLGPDDANIEGVPVSQPADTKAALEDKDVDEVRILPRAGVDYSRLLRFVYYLRAAGRQPVIVFDSPQGFGAPSREGIEELSRRLSSADESELIRAAVRLKTAVGELFAFDSTRSVAENRNAIDDWLKWLEKNNDYLYFDGAIGTYSFDAAAAAAGVPHEQYWFEKLRIPTGNVNGSDNGKEKR
jgi:hypothetical protein